jgi:hypothetical protein
MSVTWLASMETSSGSVSAWPSSATPVQQMGAGQLRPEPGPAQPGDGLVVAALSSLTLAEQWRCHVQTHHRP